MTAFRQSLLNPIPADGNTNPVALLAGQVSDGVVVPIGVTMQLDGSYALQTVVGSAAPALATAQIIGAIGMTGTAAVILPAAPTRKRHSLTNTGLNTVYLGTDGTVTSSNGIPLAVGATTTLDPVGVAYTGAVYGICAIGLASEIRGIIYS